MNTVYKLFIFLFICLILFTGCDNFLDLSDTQNLSDGEGIFCLEISGVNAGRTILPTTVQSNFAAYTFVFSTSGRDSISVDRTNSNRSNPVTLPAATWNLTVTAYMDSGKTQAAAEGFLTGIVISNGVTIGRSLELKAIIEEGANGTFRWNIGFPEEVTIASIIIIPLNEQTGTPRLTIYLKGGTPLVSANNASSPLSLRTGFYQVEFNLTNGEHNIGREEILHIYKNMESHFTYTFTQDHFSVYSVTNGNDSGPGSLRNAIQNAANNSTIYIEDNVNIIELTSRLDISRNLTIQGNGATITRASSWTTVNDESQLVINRGTTTISRIHFKNGRATNYGSAIRNIATLNLESCIFSGNQSNPTFTNYGGTINNGPIFSNAGAAILNVKACTFFENRSYAICNTFPNSTLNLQGNIFIENISGVNVRQVIYNNQTNPGIITSLGFNVADVPIGTGEHQSGWVKASTDITINNPPIEPINFKIIQNSQELNIITLLPNGYPKFDFYGNTISNNSAAGAVQTTGIQPIYYVTNGNNSGAGSLREAIFNALRNSIINIEDYVNTIELESRLDINKSLNINGNGVIITRASSWLSVSDFSQFIHINNNITVTINRVHFKNGRALNYGSAIRNQGNLTLEACIFSGNQSSPSFHNTGGAVFNASEFTNFNATLNVKACTFYGNSSTTYGGAISNAFSTSTLYLQGNLFVGNTGGVYPVIYNNQNSQTNLGIIIPQGYNVADIPTGTGTNQSGWNDGTGGTNPPSGDPKSIRVQNIFPAGDWILLLSTASNLDPVSFDRGVFAIGYARINSPLGYTTFPLKVGNIESGPSNVNYTGSGEFYIALYNRNSKIWLDCINSSTYGGNANTIKVETRITDAIRYNLWNWKDVNYDWNPGWWPFNDSFVPTPSIPTPISDPLLYIETFQPYANSAAANIIITRPAEYPLLDFYGEHITNNASAGAVQSTIGFASIFNITFRQSIDMAPFITGPILYRVSNGGPTTATVTVSNPSQYESISWQVNNTNVTGSGPSFTLSANNFAYNNIGEHFLTVMVIKDGVPYNKTVSFRIQF